MDHLEHELTEQELNTWIRPLHALEDAHTLRLLAPNRFVMDWVRDRFLPRISNLARELAEDRERRVLLEVGTGREDGLPAPYSLRWRASRSCLHLEVD